MIPRARRIDNNQHEIIAEFEQLGWSVIDTHTLGKGFPDIVIAKKSLGYIFKHPFIYGWKVIPIEIKNGNEPYTPAEIKFMEKYPGLVTTIRSVEQVKELFG